MIYGDNQVLEITSALAALVLGPYLLHFCASLPLWLIMYGFVSGCAMLYAIGRDSLFLRSITMRFLLAWYACIILVELSNGTHDFHALHSIYGELIICTYNVIRLNREYIYRGHCES